MNKLVPFTKVDEELQIAYGEVYVPDVLDSQQDFMTAVEIQRMAHNFLGDGNVNKVDTEHNKVPNGTVVVESFIARAGDPDFIEGSWVAGVRVTDDLWPLVKSGELSGFSMQGRAQQIERDIEINVPDDGILSGETQKSEDGSHEHKFVIEFNDEGQMVGGKTDTVDGHSHKITKGTKTDKANDHVHRFNFLEQIA